jgi:hypothetical protein
VGHPDPFRLRSCLDAKSSAVSPGLKPTLISRHHFHGLKAVASTAVPLAQDALRAQGARQFSLLLCPGGDSLCGPGLKPLFNLRHHFHGLNSLRKKSENSKNIPQRLKPESFRRFFGTAEAVPFQNNGVFMAR